jgi:hypothetical protein
MIEEFNYIVIEANGNVLINQLEHILINQLSVQLLKCKSFLKESNIYKHDIYIYEEKPRVIVTINGQKRIFY